MRPEGIEPPTNRVEAGCSNPLSYGRRTASSIISQGGDVAINCRMPATLVLLDGNSLLYRGFFAMRALTTSAGQPTNAIYAFTNMLLSLTEQHKPTLMFCAWDRPEPTFRHLKFDGYKGTRQETPDDLRAQGPLARELCQVFGVPPLEAAGFEADDIIGTLARRGRDAGYDVLIVTGDLDALQLVEPGVRVVTTVKGVTDTVIYDEAAVDARYGLKPNQLADYRALKGDPSDNIPGVAGIGEKTAIKLLQLFGTVDNLLHKMDEVTPGTLQAKLVGGTESMLMSRELAIIERNVPLEEVEFPAPDVCPPYVPDWEKVRGFFEKLEFRTLLKRLPGTASNSPIIGGQGVIAEVSEPYVGEARPDARKVELTVLETAPEKPVGPVAVSLHTSEGDALECVLYGVALCAEEGTAHYVALNYPPAPENAPLPPGLGGLFDDTSPQ